MQPFLERRHGHQSRLARDLVHVADCSIWRLQIEDGESGPVCVQRGCAECAGCNEADGVAWCAFRVGSGDFVERDEKGVFEEGADLLSEEMDLVRVWRADCHRSHHRLVWLTQTIVLESPEVDRGGFKRSERVDVKA